MQKQLGAIMLIAGTCIGSGMIALPMMLAKIGIVPSIIFMTMMWLLMYFTSLITVELSLQNNKGTPLGALAKKYSGKAAEVIGYFGFKILSYALVAVYIYAGSSVLEKMLGLYTGISFNFNNVAIFYAIAVMLIFLLPIKIVDYLNRILFISLLTVIAALIIGLIYSINWSNLPLFAENYHDISIWKILLPVIFTSFGFQGTCHVLVNYCSLDREILKKSLLWGSFIPLVVYAIWNTSCLAVIYNNNPTFYNLMVKGKVEVGDLVKELSHIAKWKSVQILTWWITILAIVTSVLGVGISLCDSLKQMLPSKIKNINIRNILAAIITVIPSYLVAILVPGAFIKVLGFAGMTLAIIAILLPNYLLYKLKPQNLNFSLLHNKFLLIASLIVGIIIILCELL